MRHIDGHAGDLVVEVMTSYGIDALFTLNGAHIWPFYEAARSRGVRVVDTRHEQSAAFAAEAWSKLTRRPGVAALTAGPGITNGISAITSAWMNGSPLVVLGGRAASARWGSGQLQELDHVPIVASITKSAATLADGADAATDIAGAIATALTPHRGPVFRDYPLDVFGSVSGAVPDALEVRGATPDPDAVERVAQLLARSQRPAFVVGSDVWWDRAEAELVAAAEAFDVPCFANGMGRGVVPPGHRLSCSRTRPLLKTECDLVVVIGTALDFRLGYGRFGAAAVVHLADADGGAGGTGAGTEIAERVVGDLRTTLAALAGWSGDRVDHAGWVDRVRDGELAAAGAEQEMLTAGGETVKPGRVYGELARRIDPDSVVICDGGDFASYAGKLVEVRRAGGWLDTGPYGCLGNGPGYAIGAAVARPGAQRVLLLGDGAAGFSLMDVDSLVRHGMPTVMIVGNNGCWGLEKHPMQMIYGWDMACDLDQATSYDGVVRALGGAGETVSHPDEVGPALDRAFASGVPYLVNVLTDPTDAYPRSSNLM